MELFICGCRGTCPVSGEKFIEFGCATSCYLLRENDYALIIDCGSGLANAKPLIADCKRIDVIITHLHYDHVIGLLHPAVFPKEATVRFYSGFGNPDDDNGIRRFMAEPFWPFLPTLGEFILMKAGDCINLQNGETADIFKGCHPNGCMMARVNFEDKRIFFVGDYEHGTIELGELVDGVDILVYDGSYTDEQYPSREGWGHSTWRCGTETAKRANVKTLIITHHGPEKDDDTLRAEEKLAQKEFSCLRFAREGDIINLA